MQNNRINVLFVATATAIVHAAISVAFVPFFSTLLVSLIGSNASTAATDIGMTLAVLTPLIYAAVGFLLGALMALGYNAFVWALLPAPVRREEVVVEQETEIAAAAVGDAA